MYNRLFLVLCTVVFASSPLIADAGVRLNEIAWMGTDAGGANCEWIELYNDGSDIVDLSSWTITITNTGSTPRSIALGDAGATYTGIAANGFYLIARNSGSCSSLSPATTADWLGSFGNGISNTGSKIELLNGATVVDTADATEGWTGEDGFGGKNPSGGVGKETPQYSGGRWITAVPTPRITNATISTPDDTLPDDHDEVASTTPEVTIGGATPTVPAVSPLIKRFIEPGPNRVVSVGAETPYEAIIYDATGRMIRGAQVTWNFGDGGTKSGEVTTHAYREAGEYTVVVRARERGQSTIAMLTVVAEPAKVRVGTSTDTGFSLTNESSRLQDLSSWKVKAGGKTFTLPEDTVIRAGASVFFSSEVTRLPTTTPPSLLFPDGKLASAYMPEEQLVAVEESIEIEQEVVPVPVAVLPTPSYAEEVRAPAPAAIPAEAGAVVPPGNVILKASASDSFFGGLLDSLTTFIVR